MNKGAYWAGSPLKSDNVEPIALADSAGVPPPHGAVPPPHGAVPPPSSPQPPVGIALSDLDDEAPVRPAASAGEKIVLGVIGLAAFAWIALMVSMALFAVTHGQLTVPDLVRGISTASGPLALIVVLLVLWQRNNFRGAQRFAEVARQVRMESLALDAVVSLASRRLAEDRLAVADQADRMLLLADQTAAQIRAATEDIAKEIAELGRRSQDLDAAAGTARVDMGVLLADLPKAEEQTRLLAEVIRATGIGAQEQAVALDTVLAGITQRSHDAEERATGATTRLATRLSELGSAADVATQGIQTVSDEMTASVDGVIERAAEAVERTRQGIVAQGEAIGAMIDRAQNAAESAAVHAADALARQDGLGAAMLERIQRGLAHVEARFAELDESGRVRTERLGDSLGLLGGHVERVMASLNDGGTAATTFINRAETLRGAIAACVTDLGETLPAALSELEMQAGRSRETIAAAGPEAERLNRAASEAAQALDAARVALEERRAAIEGLADAIDARLTTVREGTGSLSDAIGQIDTQAAQLADSTSPKLVDALIRVRETATQAAERAREALGTIIPRSAEALGEAGRAALEKAMGDEVENQIARVAAVSDAAVTAAEAASQRLADQLAQIAETSASVEDHIADGKAEVEATDRDNFSRRVAHLIDSLNSTAIDVTKLLSNDASDSAWTSYLRGDRGVFTRRAVKLIENGEAREITRHYEDEPEFRDQVNRYIHDFEALLRPILATRDGSTLGVILLSSDMGKLYVALAQAIARLRT